jgi:hypothetical protein
MHTQPKKESPARPPACSPRAMPPSLSRPAAELEAPFPLRRLPNLCCPSGACRDVEYRSMEYGQQAWLQLDSDDASAEPGEFFAFSSRGVALFLAADVPFRPGDRALLLTQAHGAGISHRPVRCCWQRLHPSDPRLRCLGLRFEGKEAPEPPIGSAEG